MDDAALARVRQRMSAGAHVAELEDAVERSRARIEALASSAAELEAALPEQVGEAVRAGLRTEVLPVAKHIAELRGLFNQANRRLERIEADLRAERQARVDDLALLVELVSSGWRGVDARLARLETAAEATGNALVEHLPSKTSSDPPDEAIVDRAA